MQKLKFDYPIPSCKANLTVTATVDGRDAEIDKIVYMDKYGCVVDVTDFVHEHAGSLIDTLVDEAFDCVRDEKYSRESDYTSFMQDKY